jgi:hypothetical protein
VGFCNIRKIVSVPLLVQSMGMTTSIFFFTIRDPRPLEGISILVFLFTNNTINNTILQLNMFSFYFTKTPQSTNIN